MTQDIVSRFEEIASMHRDSPAVIEPGSDGEQVATYADLDRRRLEIARALTEEHGIEAGDRIGIVPSQHIDVLAAMLGVVTIGASYVPLDPELPPDRLNFIVKDADVRLTVSAGNAADRRCIPISSLNGETGSYDGVAATDCAYIMFTSGSTGNPKGVMIPHCAVHRLVVDTDFMRLDNNTRFLHLAPQSFDASTLEIWGPLLNGGVVVLYPDEIVDPDTLRRVLRRYHINALWLTAALFNQFVSRWPDVLDGIDCILFGGERASVPHVRAAFNRYVNTTLINGYGPTENTTFTCCHRVVANDVTEDITDLPIGKAISGTRIKIVDDDGNIAESGKPGELLAGGKGLAIGYLNRDELNTASFIVDEDNERWYRTGDLASERDDGAILYLGRKDRQLKIAGHRIEPGEIESEILKADVIRNVNVSAQETGDGTSKLVAYVVGELDESSLRQRLSQNLPGYMIPSVFVSLDELPVTKNGKVDTAKLPNPFSQNQAINTGQDGSELAKAIATVWTEVVSGLKLSSFDENFFDVGGTSMDMLRVKEKLDAYLKTEMPTVTLFTYPTINKLAAHLGQSGGNKSAKADIRDRARQRRQKLSQRSKKQM